ncbi:MBL fold metallo-hydrolase [Pseudodesulfovibrio sp. JC047]|uniref:MBL fold metallo-hydrolase n=1 Tax=Pseudodesulfovibrio sp. JC047 TaxID=2683199 RepID=UPI0013D0F66A|nr:MBL fold metallo-hydrolase [Pseudodesulfovibrio sp. JC047]NDV18859.1 MBL fold metallo-hydrolase [Pseudodesulfovibrio sp. JC047]
MSTVTIERFVLGMEETNCYLLTEGKNAVLVDVGTEPQPVIARIREQGLALVGVYITHFHVDHVGGVQEVLEAFSVPVYASGLDAFFKELSIEAGGYREIANFLEFPVEIIAPGPFRVLGQEMHVLDTPGHTPGSLSFFFPAANSVFVGDVLFKGAVGRTDLPRGSSSELFQSIRSRIFTLPDTTSVYPGHGPVTTVAHEKRHNPYCIR